MRWLRLGLFQSIRPSIKYQPRKANILADAITRSQQNIEEDPTNDLAMAAIVEEEVLALSAISVKLTVKDLQQ